MLNENDTTIATSIFEDFDIDSRSNLYRDNLKYLSENGWINDAILQKAIQLHNKFCIMQVDFPELWNMNAIRTAPEWHEILSLSDEIKTMLYVS
ncbi:MAG: hypothetical protein K2J71_08220 [Oscillospiraceae bacterium]|nr:hypothetical protein [Oscillospiraceae bacterium]